MSKHDETSTGGSGTSPRHPDRDADENGHRRPDAVLQLLQDVAVKMNEPLSVEEALAFALERICRYTHWPVGHALLLSSPLSDVLKSTGVFFLVDEDAFSHFKQVTLNSTFERGRGLPGRVLESSEPKWISDVMKDEDFPRAAAVANLDVTTGFGVPILTGQRVVGVLEFFSRSRKEPDTDLVSVAFNIGAQLGRVIEREQAAEAVRSSEERLRALADSTLEAIITADSEGLIIDWNKGGERIFGYSEEEAIGRSVELIMPSTRVEAHRKGMRRFHQTLEPSIIGSTIEVDGRRKDGSEIPIELSLSTYTARSERFFTAIIRDISQRRRTEEEMRQNRERLRRRERQLERAQRIAQLGSWEWFVETGSLWWSDEMYRIYGLDPSEEISFEKYVSLLHPDDRSAGQDVIRRTLETREPFSFYHRIVRADTGEVRTLHGEGEVEIDEQGRVVKMYGTGLDVTRLRRVEEDLRESERKFRLLAENMTDLILLQNPDGDLVYVSPSSHRILGYNADELYGKNLYDLLKIEDAEQLRAGPHGEMLEGKSYTEAHVRAQTKDGATVWIELTGKPIVEDDGTIKRLLASARDVTERVRAEEEAATYRLELERRNRELQDFAHVASHDLQEPLRKIRAFSDLLDTDYGDVLGEEGRVFVDRVRHAATRMSTLITDLLSFSRVTTQGGTFEPTDLNDVIEGVLIDLEIAVKESGAEIDVGDLPTLEVDPVQMRQLFQNLIGNAIKFQKPDEPPRIEIRATIRASGVGRRKLCRVEVTDNGVGFDPKHAARIFSPFQRLHNRAEVEGTGMGLAICRRIVERHDGRISAESEVNAGTTFIVELPVRRKTANGT